MPASLDLLHKLQARPAKGLPNTLLFPSTMTSTIPSPPSVPFLGHVASIEREVPLRSFRLLSEQYGEIWELNLLGSYASCRVSLTN